MASTIGFQVAFAPFIGIAIGYFLDWEFGTYPVYDDDIPVDRGAAAGVNYYRFAKQQREEDKGKKK